MEPQQGYIPEAINQFLTPESKFFSDTSIIEDSELKYQQIQPALSRQGLIQIVLRNSMVLCCVLVAAFVICVNEFVYEEIGVAIFLVVFVFCIVIFVKVPCCLLYTYISVKEGKKPKIMSYFIKHNAEPELVQI